MEIRKYWLVVRRVWITVGLSATAVFVIWSLLAYRANTEAKAAAVSDAIVAVSFNDGIWQYSHATALKPTTLLFFPGGLVDPRAYAPLARAVAEAGYPVLLVELPYRGAFGGAESVELQERISSALALIPASQTIVTGGHSRGAVVASALLSSKSEQSRKPVFSGAVLIATTHPRDVDLSQLTVPVTKIVGTRDGLASPDKVRTNANLLPEHTHWLWIEGANHSQFGWYGFQPMDRRATISATDQRRIMTDAVIEFLQSTEGGNTL
jgi:pimeloyl-ACP methyl ester carboxylesterase